MTGRTSTRTPLRARLADWWREPRLNGWVFTSLAGLLFLRRPDALLKPQLWAEDGSVFLLGQDAKGFVALFEPYMGYLHTLPRLTAWAADALLDVAWWPAFYHAVAFAVWLGVLARLFSSRLNLPHRPWLAAGVLLAVQTPEIFLNLTNAQWAGALLLLQQAMLARPVGSVQRAGDFALVALFGLTGPFIIPLLPLFAWRWWRDRQADNIALLLVAATCAALQGACLHHAAITFEHQHAPLDAAAAVVALARRLVVWPLLGPTAARDLPAIIQAALGAAVFGFVTWRAVRADAHRPTRLALLGAGALLMSAGFIRMRPDTWSGDDLAFSDRYFFHARVILFWLLAFELAAAGRTTLLTSRLALLAAVFTHLPAYRFPAPPDFSWRERCDPIRRGTAADIPILPAGWTLHYPGRPPSGQR
ncbi:MAG: hypothetical protein ACKPB0_09310 [Opitutaceae bacterium]